MEEVKLHPIFRLIHWSVAFIILLNAFMLEQGDLAHQVLGYICLGFIFLRIIISKKKNVTYYHQKAKYVYWLIWCSIFGLTITGFMMGLDRFWGNQKLEYTHELISDGLLALVLIHLCGVFLDAIKNKRKTWMVMFNGIKEK